MNIQAIRSAMCTSNCQPIRSQSFSQLPPDYSIKDTENGDIFTPTDPYTQEQKLDMACRLAAYYQTQYEKLQQKTGCLA